MASSVFISRSPSSFNFNFNFCPTIPTANHPHLHLLFLPSSRRIPYTSPRVWSVRQNGHSGVVSDASRSWRRSGIRDFVYNEEEEEGDDSEDESEDRSLDLLVRFVQNVFRKVSKRARKAVRSVLPISISTQLVGFSVNGVIILAFLWVLKALLEVVCTFGSLVFVSILLIRGIWSGISYLQESRNQSANDFDGGAWTGAQPAG